MYDAGQTLLSDYAPTGGAYLPADLIRFEKPEIKRLFGLTPAESMAEMLNLLFDTTLSYSDLNFHIGRYPLRLRNCGRGLIIGECWHNISGSFDETMEALIQLMGGSSNGTLSGWRKIGCGCAVLCGLLCQLEQLGDNIIADGVDFAAGTGDFSLLMSAWYLRRWGFPIRTIVCAAGEEDSVWDLANNGTFRSEKNVPAELGRLIYHLTDLMEAGWFAECCSTGKTFAASEELQQALRDELEIYVISADRCRATISGEFGRNQSVLAPDAACAYAAAMDHRVRSHSSSQILIAGVASPYRDAAFVAEALGTTETAFLNYWNNR